MDRWLKDANNGVDLVPAVQYYTMGMRTEPTARKPLDHAPGLAPSFAIDVPLYPSSGKAVADIRHPRIRRTYSPTTRKIPFRRSGQEPEQRCRIVRPALPGIAARRSGVHHDSAGGCAVRRRADPRHTLAATDGTDTDFTAKLCDVYPDGAPCSSPTASSRPGIGIHRKGRNWSSRTRRTNSPSISGPRPSPSPRATPSGLRFRVRITPASNQIPTQGAFPEKTGIPHSETDHLPRRGPCVRFASAGHGGRNQRVQIAGVPRPGSILLMQNYPILQLGNRDPDPHPILSGERPEARPECPYLRHRRPPCPKLDLRGLNSGNLSIHWIGTTEAGIPFRPACISAAWTPGPGRRPGKSP